jgi:hypothetical protein
MLKHVKHLFFLFLIAQSVNAQICDNVISLGNAGGDACTHLAKMPSGLTVGGIFQQNISFNGIVYNSAGAFDIFLSNYDSSGQLVNAMSIGNSGNNELSAMTSDNSGNLYLSGTFTGQLNLGSYGFQSTTITHFIAKINPQGQLIWAEQLQAKGINKVYDLQVSPDGQFLWVCGEYNDSLKIGTEQLYSPFLYNLFVLKLNSWDGAADWLRDVPDAKWAKARTLAPLPDGTAWIAAEFKDSLVLTGNTYYYSRIHSDILFAKIDANGQWQSSKRWGGVYEDKPKKLRLAPDRQTLWLCGDFVAVLNVDQFQLMTAFRFYDAFWIKIDLAGNALAVGQSNTIANCYVYDIAFQGTELWLGGYFQDSLQGADQMHYPVGGFDIFWYRIDTTEALLRKSETAGGTGNDLINALAAYGTGVYAAGTYQQMMEWNGQSTTASGFSDGWLGCIPSGTAAAVQKPIPNFIAVKISPNPSSDQFRIELETPMPLRWELYSMEGRRILTGNTEIIDAAKLTKGTYSLTVYTEKGIAVAKLIRR